MDSDCLDTNVSDTLSGKIIPKKSSRKGLKTGSSKTPQSSLMSIHSLIQEVPSFIEGLRTSSQRGLLARLGREQENSEEQKTNVISGLSHSNASESSNRPLHFLKMSLDSLGQPIAVLKDKIWMNPQLSMFDISERFSANFPKWGIMQDGACWELMMLAHTTAEKESGYWLTPYCTLISGGEGRREKRRQFRKSIGRHDVAGSLAGQVSYPELSPIKWPTPRVSDTEGAPIKNAEYKNGSWSRLNAKGVRFGIKLKDAIHHIEKENMLPTPRLSDHKGSGILGSKSQAYMERKSYLCATVATEKSGQLNPDWAEFYLMGWPRNWTSLNPLISEEMKEYAKITNFTRQKVSSLPTDVQSEKIQWGSGRPYCLRKETILQPNMYGDRGEKGESEQGSVATKVKQDESTHMPNLRDNRASRYSSCGWGYYEQCGGQQDDVVRCLSREMALEAWDDYAEATIGLQNLWDAFKRTGLLSKALRSLQEIWQSLNDKEKSWLLVCAYSGVNWAIDPYDVDIMPRVTNETKDRANRLKAIGNGQVTACMATAFTILIDGILKGELWSR